MLLTAAVATATAGRADEKQRSADLARKERGPTHARASAPEVRKARAGC
jgi:hypothetical protein